jgi:ATP/maltotriose-dependent transcriptional regulator MalT
MAEGLLRHRAGDRFDVRSAGTDPKPIHPLAVQALKEIDIDISGQKSKHLPHPTEVQSSPLLDPLSDRELEVLRLVATGLSNQDIADKLVIAVSTVKSHTNKIFGKLAVQNRTEAVAKARGLGLL